MNLDDRIREAEASVFAGWDLHVDESYADLPRTGARTRILSTGAGADVLLLHGVTMTAAIWAPLVAHLAGYRAHLVELPGHGLSGPFRYRVGAVRAHAVDLVDDLLDALGLRQVPVVGHSLGGMFALWYAAARPGGIRSLVAIGEPAVALPGARVRMPLSVMTVPVVGRAVLLGPTPRRIFRGLLAQGLGREATASVPDDLVDVLRLATRRAGNAATTASLMHAINGFRRARPESVMLPAELGRISIPARFCIGDSDPFLGPDEALPSIRQIPLGELREVHGGHAPWLEDPAGVAQLVIEHLTATSTGAGAGPTSQ